MTARRKRAPAKRQAPAKAKKPAKKRTRQRSEPAPAPTGAPFLGTLEYSARGLAPEDAARPLVVDGLLIHAAPLSTLEESAAVERLARAYEEQLAFVLVAIRRPDERFPETWRATPPASAYGAGRARCSVALDAFQTLFPGGKMGATYARHTGAYWSHRVAEEFGPGALLETAAELARIVDTRELPNNTLSEICDRVALKLRRDVLLWTLEKAGWNLSDVADRLRLGNASAVIREIRRCGLDDAYAAAKERGKVAPGGHKVRTPD